MAINPYISELFSDFKLKQNSIRSYNKRTSEGSQAIEDAVYQWLTLLKKKSEVIEEFRKSRQKSVPSSQFALEQSQDSIQQTSNEDLKGLEEQINNKAQIINHLFQKTEKDLVYLTQSYKHLTEIVNSISDSFDKSFHGI
jgi:Mg2+ and Co2+ transporter CorA